jgi:hypothetical protein
MVEETGGVAGIVGEERYGGVFGLLLMAILVICLVECLDFAYLVRFEV